MEAIKTAQIIDINSKDIIYRLGYSEDNEPSVRVRKLVNDYIENYHHLVEPAYSWTFREIEAVERDKVILGESAVLESRVMANLCKRCDKAAVFIVTIGNYLEDMVAYLSDNGVVLQATVLDTIGSAAAEQMAALIEDRIKSIAEMSGQCISRRFSPGYCDWNVKQQEILFRILKDDPAGVTLTEECLMLPRKSVSGIIGIGDTENGVESYNPCGTCVKTECPGRRE